MENKEWLHFPFEHLLDMERTVTKRCECNRCRRPARVCICAAFPCQRFQISTNIHILQHPREQSERLLTTVPLLQECLSPDKCLVYRGKKFSETRYLHLHRIFKQPNTVLLFPSKDAIMVEDYVKEDTNEEVNLIVLDGTWREARSIYHNNPVLHSMPKVMLSGKWQSQFVIRTQPNNDSVSTIEAVAIAIAQFEDKPQFIEIARKPLNEMCDIQLQHGAEVHESKEALAQKGIKYRVFEPGWKKAKKAGQTT